MGSGLGAFLLEAAEEGGMRAAEGTWARLLLFVVAVRVDSDRVVKPPSLSEWA